jgi:hypothetical protein
MYSVYPCNLGFACPVLVGAGCDIGAAQLPDVAPRFQGLRVDLHAVSFTAPKQAGWRTCSAYHENGHGSEPPCSYSYAAMVRLTESEERCIS